MSVTEYRPPVFPFTALVGQDALKLALVINAVHPGVMGVLIRGQKGTAKSTAARALAELLPPIKVVRDCQYGCDPDAPLHRLCEECKRRKDAGEKLESESVKVPFVTLPVNATEDSLVGSIDFEYALKSGIRRFQPGVLASVHRGILYVDEVNLLDDHLVDLLLDVAASGVNVVEREGVSYVHPAEFVLVGTMNPEEGELRPQFLDRFGLCVQIESIEDAAQRVEIIKRREAFEENPAVFLEEWRRQEEKEQQRILRAIELFDHVKLTQQQYRQVAQICREAGVAGHRADIIIEKCSRAIAAYLGKAEVEDRDIRLAAYLALPHRARKVVEDELPSDDEKGRSDETNEENPPEEEMPEGESEGEEFEGSPEETSLQEGEEGAEHMDHSMEALDSEAAEGLTEEPEEVAQPCTACGEEVFDIGNLVPIGTKDLRYNHDTTTRKSSGRRHRSRTTRKSGRYVRSTMQRFNDDLALDATLRAAAPYQLRRDRGPMAISIEPQDIREKIRERKTASLLVFVVDASGSMGTKLMTETKGAIMYLLLEAYQKRDRVSMVAFKGDGSELLLPPTDSIDLAKKKLEELPTGGKTPLCAGLLHGYELVRDSLRRNPDLLPLLILITDGRANVGVDPRRSYEGIYHSRLYEELYAVADALQNEPRLKSLVIDAEEKRMGAFGKAEKLAERMGAKYLVLEELRSGHIAEAVRMELGR